MERQLKLLEQDAEWRLDERTREIGRAGVARAREALLAARQRSAAQAADGTGSATRTAA
jgi:hypothetical protein